MLLVIGIGNSNVGFGLYRGEILLARWRAATVPEATTDEYAVLLSNFLAARDFSPIEINGCALSSVVPPLTPVFVGVGEGYLGSRPLVVRPGVNTGMRVLYDHPEQLGADRLVDAVAARERYGAPVVILDCGTATTLNVVSPDGDFLGGAIAPGLGISADALYRMTAQLPRIELVAPDRVTARNTVTGMQAGVVLGYAGLVGRLIRQALKELGTEAPVVATGGFAPVLAPHVPAIDHVNRDLILEGLRLIWEMNHGHSDE